MKDLHGAWEGFLGFNAPLYARKDESKLQKTLNVDYAVKYWLSNNVAREKLILGLATYGRSFTMSGSSSLPGSKASAGGIAGTVIFF